MKAIRIHSFGDPDVMKLEDVPTPAPAAGQVLVDVRSIGVNPVDTYICTGKYGARPFPHTPGFDAAGIVESVGDGVTSVKKGDRVYVSRTISGAYAEKTLADQANVYPLPENVGFDEGAALGVPFGTAYRALHHRGQAKPAETVLVHGATGGVGIAAVQMARAHGCTVIGTGGSARGRLLVEQLGAHHVLDHHDASYLEKLMDFTRGRGVDLILEMLANVNLAKDLGVLAKFGRVVVVGSRGKIEIDPRDTMSRDADIRGLTMMNATNDELRAVHAAIRAGLESGVLRPIIESKMPLANAAKAHVDVLEGNSHGKIVLVP
ncbi:MAG: NADPH:quinone reductase [Phycisphaerales bacterium]|jgi:NADPH2:quinone reductase|nr:NADPH:quinone reductase [Phycisphaerales bacterium]